MHNSGLKVRYSHFRFCYTEDLEGTLKLALPTLYAAKKYIMPVLENKSRDVLINILSSKNIWETYTGSLSFSDDLLIDACRKYFTDSVSKVASALKSPDFLTIPAATLLDFLQINDGKYDRFGIVIADIEVFKACNAWAEAECLRQGMDPTGENKRKVLGDGLFNIHFPDMLSAHVVNIVSPIGILTCEEQLDLLAKTHVGPLEKGQRADLDRSPVKFCSRASSSTVLTDFSSDDNEVIEISQIDGEDVCFHCIEVDPKTKLLLSGIWLNFTHNVPRAQYEVVMITRTIWKYDETSDGEVLNTSCTMIESEYAEDEEGNRFVYLQLEKNQLLDTGFRYLIKTALLNKFDTMNSRQRNLSLPLYLKTSDQLNMKVHVTSNQLISGFTLQLV